MTLVQKLQSILSSKLDIKSAITTKTGSSPGDVLADYADDISGIQPEGIILSKLPPGQATSITISPSTLTSNYTSFQGFFQG